MKVSFCIICYDKDAHLVGRLLRDLKNQTSYPDEVIVVASGMTELKVEDADVKVYTCLLYTSPSPRDKRQSRMPSSA